MRPPSQVGAKLEEFGQGGELNKILSQEICKKCPHDCVEEGKSDCPGFIMLCWIENIIGEEGIKFMKEVANQWTEQQKEKYNTDEEVHEVQG